MLDAPRSVYGLEEKDARQNDILADGTGIITIYGLLGDKCLDNRDCFMDFTECIEGFCSCQEGFMPASSNNLTCLGTSFVTISILKCMGFKQTSFFSRRPKIFV